MSLGSMLLQMFDHASTPDKQWELGLYLTGEDPTLDLEAAEVTGGGYSRMPCIAWKTVFSGATSAIISPSPSFFVFTSLPAASIDGVFLARPGDTVATTYWPFYFTVTTSASTLMRVDSEPLVIAISLTEI